MKIRNLLIISIGILLGLSSCKKDDVDTIVGTWKYSSINFDIEVTDPTIQSYLELATGFIKASISDITVTFNDNGTYSMTTTIGGDTDSDTGTYSIKDGKLYMDDEATNYTLSKNTLTIQMSAADMLGDDELEIDPSIIKKFNVTMIFNRK